MESPEAPYTGPFKASLNTPDAPCYTGPFAAALNGQTDDADADDAASTPGGRALYTGPFKHVTAADTVVDGFNADHESAGA
eukprot:3050702-Prymnesium_polylepis.1